MIFKCSSSTRVLEWCTVAEREGWRQPAGHASSCPFDVTSHNTNRLLATGPFACRHDAFRDLMQDRQKTLQYMSITFITGSTVAEELGKAINGDLRLQS